MRDGPDPTNLMGKTTQNFLNRLQMLQSNLSRVHSQHKALLPLLDLVELIPHVEKNLDGMQQLKMRLDSLANNMTDFSNTLRHNSHHGAISSIDNNFKSTQSQIQELKARLKEIQIERQSTMKNSVARVKEQGHNILRGLDIKIMNSKNDISHYIKQFRRHLFELQQSASERIRDSRILNRQQAHFQNEVHNVKRQLGLLQCEVEFILDLERTVHIKQSMKNLSNLTQNERNFNVGYLEQQMFVQEFEKFEESNDNRLKYEISLLENSLNNFKNKDKSKLQLQFIEDRYCNLQHQIKGAATKKEMELRRLTNRMTRIEQLIRQLTPAERNNLLGKIRQTELLKSKLMHSRKMMQGGSAHLESQMGDIASRIAVLKRSS